MYFIFPESFQFVLLVMIFIKIPIIISCLQKLRACNLSLLRVLFLGLFFIYCQDDLVKTGILLQKLLQYTLSDLILIPDCTNIIDCPQAKVRIPCEWNGWWIIPLTCLFSEPFLFTPH